MLIKCYECEREISDKAQACPHCGAPSERKKDKSVAQLESEKLDKSYKEKVIYSIEKAGKTKDSVVNYTIFYLLIVFLVIGVVLFNK